MERTQRVGIVMIPLACAFSGEARSPMFWARTLISSVSLMSQPTDATSTGFCSGSVAK